MSRLMMPRVYGALVKPDPESEPVAAAVIAIDTSDDAYLVIDGFGWSWWAPMGEVRFVDQLLTATINQADEALRTTRAVAA